MEERNVYVRMTQDELALLDIIKQATDLRVYRHDCTENEAKMFAELYGEPEYKKMGDVEWYEAVKTDYETGKNVQVIGFLERDGGTEDENE